MNDVEERIGRFAGAMFLKNNERFFRVSNVETRGQVGGRQEQVIVCSEVGSAKPAKFTITGFDLIDSMNGALESEQVTGFRQLLLIDLDKCHWETRSITPELENQFPFLKDKADYIT